MKEVLDDINEHHPKDESKLNRVTAFVRYGICGYLAAVESKNIYSQFQWFAQNYKSELLEAIVFNTIGIIALVLFIIYNISQAKIKKSVKYFVPEMKKVKSILFIGYSLLLFLYYFNIFLFDIGESGIDFNSISLLIISSFIIFITIREFIYLNRTSIS